MTLTFDNSKIKALPAELVISIVETARLFRSGSDLVGLPFAVIASHVSARWREFITTTPSFWTNIDIHSEISLNRAKIYIRRSQALLLDIAIDCKGEWMHSGDVELVKDVMRLVPHDPRRLRSFTFQSDTVGHIAAVLLHLRSSSMGTLSELRQLRLVSWNDGHDSAFESMLTDDSNYVPDVPRLELCELHSRSRNPGPAFNQLRGITALSKGITTLILRGSAIQSSPDEIHMPTLLNLSLNAENYPWDTNIFLMLRTPALECLEITSLSSIQWIRWRNSLILPEYQAINSGARGVPKLQALRMIDCEHDSINADTLNIGHSNFHWLMSTFPNITDFAAIDCNWEGILRPIGDIPASEGVGFWLNLKSLTLCVHHINLPVTSERILRDFIRVHPGIEDIHLDNSFFKRGSQQNLLFARWLYRRLRVHLIGLDVINSYLFKEIHAFEAEETIFGIEWRRFSREICRA